MTVVRGPVAARRAGRPATAPEPATLAARAAVADRPHADLADGPVRLEFRAVTKCFPVRGGRSRLGTRPRGTITAVEDLTFALAGDEVVAIIGPSGCGKSTCLGMASGLDRATAGEVFVDGQPVDGPNEHVAFMLQKDLLLPWRTIRQNVEFGQEIRGVDRAERRRRAEALLARFRLADFADSYPHQISGGMRQRAALARTLANDPDVLLLDEPFSALDAQTKMVLQRDLAATLAERRKAALLITHDLEEAVAMSDRVLVMSARPGRIVREIPVDLPDRGDPFARRQNPAMAAYTKELMGLLHLGDEPEGR